MRIAMLIWCGLRSVAASVYAESSAGNGRAVSAKVVNRCINILCVEAVSLATAKGVLTLAVFVVSCVLQIIVMIGFIIVPHGESIFVHWRWLMIIFFDI